jgi:aspartyl-tRNA(Asn)/glutamyl-tRNA(Gln) amidotransferase subunit A
MLVVEDCLKQKVFKAMTAKPLQASSWKDIQDALAKPDGAMVLAEQSLAAIEANKELNAYRKVDPSRVRAEASVAAARRKVDRKAPALTGFPVSVKDLYVVEGYETFAGTTMPLDAHFDGEGPVVRGLRDAGVVVTGKTHTVEFAFGGIGTNPHWPTPINPWDAGTERVSGGSSSGSGVSLWAGTAALALGSDTAGSVRVPASFTGCIGLKTTHGRWSIDGIVPLSPSLDTAGYLALDAEIIAEAFKVIDPIARKDPRTIQRAWPGDVKGLRLGVLRQAFDGAEPGIAEAVETSLKELEAAGAVLTDIALPEVDDALALFKVGGVAGIEFAANISNRFPDWRDKLDPNVLQRFEAIEQATAVEYLRRLDALEAMAVSAACRMDEVGIAAMVGPTVPITAPSVQEVADGARYVDRNMLALRNTVVGNFLKLSGFTIPAGKDAAGVPVGLQFMTCTGADIYAVGLLLAVQDVLGRPYDRLGAPPRVA